MITAITGQPARSGEQGLAIGENVGEYQIEQLIGNGAFGTVYRAVHPLIGKQAAIKVLARRYSADPEVVSRFIAEAKAVNQISHRHIIDIFAFGQLADGRHYYVMELLDGEPLDLHLRERGPLPLAEALPILRAIARALDAAHAKGIAHRDLKPENIFLAREPDGVRYPKLLDFGIAKLLDPEEDVRHRTGTGVPIGTPYYMSPEQCRGRGVDHRTDIYSFGVLAYRLLTGEYPFVGEDHLEVMMKHLSEEAPPASRKNPAVPRGIDRAIAWMMEKEPAQRPATVIAGVEALEAAAGATPAVAPAMPRRRWGLVLALAAAGAAVAAVAAWQLASPGGASDPAPRAAASPAAPPTTPPTTPPAPPAPPAPPVAAPPAPPPLPTLVTVDLDGAPPTASVRYLGKVIATGPRVRLAKGTDKVVLLIEAAGHVAKSIELVPDRDQHVAVRLARITHAAPQRSAADADLARPVGF